jgi:signal peptidase I
VAGEKKYKIQLVAEPPKVVSDGKQEAVIRCAFSLEDAKTRMTKKGVREDIPVTFTCKRLKLDEKVMAQRGTARLKLKPAKPVGRVRITAATPYGDADVFLTVTPTFKQWLRDMFQSLLIAFVVAMGIIRPFFLQTFFIPSGSMIETFYEGDRLLASMLVYRLGDPKPGDIVIFKSTKKEDDHTYNFGLFKYTAHTNYIKRLIAKGGDTVEIRSGVTYVNGKALKEPYMHLDETRPPIADFPKIKVPKGKLFFMGDNRNNSSDSRYSNTDPDPRRRGIGYVPRKNVVAKAWVQFWPLNRMKIVKHVRYGKK